MTKRMIDADVIENYILNNHRPHYSKDEQGRYIFVGDILINLSDIRGKINELATPAPESQESIFDADGWCWDLSLINNDDEYHFLIESHRGGVGHKVTDKKSYYQLIGLTWFIDENLKENECLGDKIIAWKPIANLPKEKS